MFKPGDIVVSKENIYGLKKGFMYEVIGCYDKFIHVKDNCGVKYKDIFQHRFELSEINKKNNTINY